MSARIPRAKLLLQYLPDIVRDDLCNPTEFNKLCNSGISVKSAGLTMEYAFIRLSPSLAKAVLNGWR